MNTIIYYIYRDAANYKIHCKEVVKGKISKKDHDDLFENYGDKLEIFYPETIGFKAPTFVTEGYAPYLDDPDNHEIEDIEITEDEPTVDMTIEEFLDKIRSGAASHPKINSEKYGLVLKEKTADYGLTLSEITEMLNMLDTSGEIYPLDISAEFDDSYAMGFISSAAYNTIDYNPDKLQDFLETNLFSTDSRTKLLDTYIFQEIKVHLSR